MAVGWFAFGGRVVTAPTNGSGGVIPADIIVPIDRSFGSLPYRLPSGIPVVEEVIHACAQGQVFLDIVISGNIRNMPRPRPP